MSESLREEILARMPEYVTSVKVKRSDIKGLDSLNVVVYYSLYGKSKFLDIHFAKKNQMTAEHISRVIKSYLSGDNWENEGGNGR